MIEEKNNGDKINELCKKLFSPQLCTEPITEPKRVLEIKLIKQMELFSNYLWINSNYKNLNLPSFTLYNSNPKKQKDEIATKVQAIDMTIAICFDSWKKTPLKNANGYTSFFKVTFNNTINKIIEEDTKNFTYVPESVKENDIRLSKECKNHNINNQDLSKLKELALEIGLSIDEYEAVRKWRLIKNPVSMETPIEEKEDSKELKDTIADTNTQSSDTQYIEIETGKRILKFINSIFRSKKRDDWWKSIVTGIFYDLLHLYFAKSGDSFDKYIFIDDRIYNLPEKPKQNQIAELIEKDPSQLSTAAERFLELCYDSVSDFDDFKNDYNIQMALKEYLTTQKEKGKHKNRGKQ